MSDDPTPKPDPTPDPAPDPTPDPTPDPAEAKTFTQDQVDRIVQDRLARAKATPPADYDDLKAKAAKFDELEQANKTELEKAQERAAQLEKEAADAKALAQRTKVDSAIVAEAARRGADTEAVLDATSLRGSLEFDDDGAPTNIAEAVDALLKAKPFLVTGGPTRGSADQGARPGGDANQLTRDDLKDMSSDEILKAQQEGRLDSVLGRR